MKPSIKYFLVLILSCFIFLSCSDKDDDEFDDDFFGVMNVTLSGGKTGVHILDFATFSIINNPDLGPVFVMSGFKDGSNEIVTDIFLSFYRVGGMVSATSYNVGPWDGAEGSLDPNTFAVSFQVLDDIDDSNYIGLSESGSINFTSTSNKKVEGTFNILTTGTQFGGGSSQDITVRIQGNFIAPSLLFDF